MSDFFDDDNYNDGFNEDSYEQGMDMALWRKLLRYTLAYRFEVIMLAICAMCTAASEIAFPLLTRSVIDAVSQGSFEPGFYALAYGFFVVLLAVSVGGFIWFGGKLRTHISHDIRQDGFHNLQALSFSYYDFRPVGWLMARMTSDCERLSNILAWGLLDLIWGFTMMLGIACAMLYMDISLALITLAVLPLLAWLSLTFQKRILKSAREVRKTNSRITGSFNESIIGVQTTKAFVKEAENLRSFGQLTDEMYRASVLNKIQAAVYLPLVLTLGSVATGLAMVFGGLEVIWGGITTGTLLAFLAYSRHFFEPIEQLAQWFAEMQMAQASAERIISLIEEEPAIQDSPAVLQRLQQTGGDSSGSLNPDQRISDIEFRDVSFSYGSGPRVLKNINLHIHAGENLAIVGSTGSGKTSLINLLCRFYEPSAGQILIDGTDYREFGLHWLQSRLGIVLQSSHVFGGSIRDNIRYGRLSATDAEVEAAARRAGAHSFIEEMENGYDTPVGEGGSKLSAGEKQLISFARAILADPAILVMDEATSSVDTLTEQRIQQGLAELLKGLISRLIAHR
ncbi:MAG: ABC transporter ATP-binding protein, partial [Pseudomonadales bacterium]|nr:ABC transporter ATP-binding protein [Pseudomonadales bacterium]